MNKLIETVSLHMENLYFTKLSFYGNYQLDRVNSCRWLVLDIMLLDYNAKYSTTNRTSRKSVENMSTQTDNDYPRTQITEYNDMDGAWNRNENYSFRQQ